jgi:hypothetical protein
MEARCQRSPRRAPKEFTETRSKRVAGIINQRSSGTKVQEEPVSTTNPRGQWSQMLRGSKEPQKSIKESASQKSQLRQE